MTEAGGVFDQRPRRLRRETLGPFHRHEAGRGQGRQRERRTDDLIDRGFPPIEHLTVQRQEGRVGEHGAADLLEGVFEQPRFVAMQEGDGGNAASLDLPQEPSVIHPAAS
jgi:hypothetical protein